MGYSGLRKDTPGISGLQREESEPLAQFYVPAGVRPPWLTVKHDGVDVSDESWRGSAPERDYRGPGGSKRSAPSRR